MFESTKCKKISKRIQNVIYFLLCHCGDANLTTLTSNSFSTGNPILTKLSFNDTRKKPSYTPFPLPRGPKKKQRGYSKSCYS